MRLRKLQIICPIRPQRFEKLFPYLRDQLGLTLSPTTYGEAIKRFIQK